MFADYDGSVIPGDGVSVDSGGNFSVDASGVLNKSAHKVNKWLKKKAGINIF